MSIGIWYTDNLCQPHAKVFLLADIDTKEFRREWSSGKNSMGCSSPNVNFINLKLHQIAESQVSVVNKINDHQIKIDARCPEAVK